MTRSKATFNTHTSSTPLSTPRVDKNFELGSSSLRDVEDLKAAAEKGKIDLVDAYLESTIKPSRIRTPGTSFKSNSTKSQSTNSSTAIETKRAASALSLAASAVSFKKEGKMTESTAAPKPSGDDKALKMTESTAAPKPSGDDKALKMTETTAAPKPSGDTKALNSEPGSTRLADVSSTKDSSVLDESRKSSEVTSNYPDVTSKSGGSDSPNNEPKEPKSFSTRDTATSLKTSKLSSNEHETLTSVLSSSPPKVEAPPLHEAPTADKDAEASLSTQLRDSSSVESDNDVSSRRKSFVFNGNIVSHVPYDILVRGCPPGVDPDKKEELLSSEEFQEHFKMSKAKFESLPKWRRDQLKKQLDLF